MLVYGILVEPGFDDWLFFVFGLLVGYITDYIGVKTKKWKYHPWDPEFGYSYYVGFAWGMVTMFTYSVGKGVGEFVGDDPVLLIIPAVVFLSPIILAEYKYGETRRDQYFLFARALFTILAFYNNLGLLFVACFIGSFIEWAGVYWIKNWLYIDNISFIFLSFGYSLVIITAKMIVDVLASNPIPIFVSIFYILAALSYILDLYWTQTKVRKQYNLDQSEKALEASKAFK